MSTETPKKLPGIPDIPGDQRTPAVVLLLELCHRQQEELQALRDEVARLKGQKPQPVIRPSALEGERSETKKARQPKPRGKRSKTGELEIHESVKCAQLQSLTALAPAVWTGQTAWQAVLAQQAITDPRHVRLVTEGALLGTVVERGVAPDLAILSDDAGQFDVLTHALCWIHAERVLARLLGFNEPQREALASVRSELWAIYDALKAYKEAPDALTAAAMQTRFEKLCATRTGYASLDRALKRMRRKQQELLRVLQRPELPLHNNLSESDIRDHVKKRQISGSTRSESGRRCRDTFASLKKTCRKNRLSFWQYLQDRVFGWHRIAPLAQWIFEATPTGANVPAHGP